MKTTSIIVVAKSTQGYEKELKNIVNEDGFQLLFFCPPSKNHFDYTVKSIRKEFGDDANIVIHFSGIIPVEYELKEYSI